MPSTPPDYGSDALGRIKARAYAEGYTHGYAGKPQPHTLLTDCAPNSAARGYWDGVGDMEEEHRAHG